MMASLDVIFKQMILSAFRSVEMDSASPGHINHFKGMKGEILGSSDEINEAIKEVLKDLQSDQNQTDKGEGGVDGLSNDGGVGGTNIPLLTPQGAASTASSATAKTLLGKPDILFEMVRKFPPAAIALLAASMAPLIFAYITRPGSDLDLRYIRNIEEEQNAFLSRQQQYDTATGFRQVITTSTIDGFLAVNGANNENTLRQYRKGANFYGELNDITNEHNAKGLFS